MLVRYKEINQSPWPQKDWTMPSSGQFVKQKMLPPPPPPPSLFPSSLTDKDTAVSSHFVCFALEKKKWRGNNAFN